MITDAIHAFLQQRVEVEKRDVGIVVGLVDEHGRSIVSCGNMGNSAGQEVNGDTLFEIGSITKTFTALLLQDMVEHGEMKLGDPVAKYLPASVKMPSRNGREITLLQLVTHTSGLPRNPDNLDPQRTDNPEAVYNAEKLYAFLSGWKLARNPGTKFEYSNLGTGLLGHIIALKTGSDYESLVMDRICRPLKMDSTRATLTPELKARFATGHNYLGYVVSSMDFNTQVGCGGLRSTANDMLKYLSANLGLMPTSLTSRMEETHKVRFRSVIPAVNVALAWGVAVDPLGRKIISHGGATYGYRAFAGFDTTRRRGVVVLSNSSYDGIGPESIGMCLLESEWQSDRRPKGTKINSSVYDSYVGQYRLSPDLKVGMLIMRLMLRNAPPSAILAPVAFSSIAVVFALLWLSASWLTWGCLAVVGSLVAPLIVLALSYAICMHLRPTLVIRREGDRLFAQVTRLLRIKFKLLPHIHGVNVQPTLNMAQPSPPITFELAPESETCFFEQMSGVPMIFFRDGRGRVARLTAHLPGGECSFKKISDQLPKTPEPLKPRSPVRLDTKLYDACVGQYEFLPDAAFPTGIKLIIRRQGDQLGGKASGKNGGGGEFDLYPESETNFFLKINGAQLIFIKNDQGNVTAVIHRLAGLPDSEGKKLEN